MSLLLCSRRGGTASAAAVSAANSTVSASPSSIPNNGSSTAVITITVRDASSQPMAGVTVTLSSTGSNNTIGQPSSATNASGVTTGTLASTTAESKTVTATAGGTVITQTAGVTVTTGASFVFESDWLTATGRSNSAITDGGYFDGQACGDQSVVANPSGIIVTCDSVGAPSVLSGLNAFGVEMVGEDCCMIQKNDALPISTTHWGQFWIRNDDNATSNTHPVAYHNIHGSDPIQAVPLQRFGNHGSSTEWQIGVPTDGSYPNNRFYTPNLTIGAWYRYEWEMEYLTGTTFRFYPRLYNASGTLLYDADDFIREGGGLSLQGWYDASASNYNTLAGDGASESAAELARNFGIGNEGPSGASDTGLFWYYAGLRFSTTDWVGGAL